MTTRYKDVVGAGTKTGEFFQDQDRNGQLSRLKVQDYQKQSRPGTQPSPENKVLF